MEDKNFDKTEDVGTTSDVIEQTENLVPKDLEEEDKHEKVIPLTIDKEARTKINKTILPSGDFVKLSDFDAVITRLIQAKVLKNYDEKTVQHILATTFAKKNYSPDGAFEDMVRVEDLVNVIKNAEKELVPRKLPFSNSKNPEVLKAKFNSALGLGDVIQMPLYHSGFWITIRPPKDNDLLSLQHAINKEIIALGRTTQTMIHSNYSVILNRLVLDFILDHVSDTTLKVDKSELKKYIVTNDIELIVLGLICSIYPDGYNYSRNCRNITEFKEDGTPKCIDYITGKINPMKTLFVNRKVLTRDALVHMAKRSPNSMTIEDVENYRAKISKFDNFELEVVGENGTVFNIVLSVPDIENYTHKGQVWVEEIISMAEELFTDTETEEGKNRKVLEMMYTMVLGLYATYIKSISIKDSDVEIEEYSDILDTLHSLSSDQIVIDSVITGVKNFINKTTIAVVAIPNYTCPTCNTEQSDSDNELTHHDDFKELIPLNVLESFFDLCVMRLARTRQ